MGSMKVIWEKQPGKAQVWFADIPNLGRYTIKWSPSWGRFRVMLNGRGTSYADPTVEGCKKCVERFITAATLRDDQ